ncbi:phospholipid scramblase 1-like [Palaemon carinicauda]|uniref:phospholipid scramblase 1-like n=1 Tax=Palaemon carinicauda TaxID=392227 RepID=UPI0035B60C26
MEPVTSEPKSQYGMMMVSSPSNNYIPPGLEYLAQLDQVIIKQIISACELLSGCEVKNRYILVNSMGQEFLYATENSDFCSRQCCGNSRSFELPFVDNNDVEVLRVSRPLKCNSCCTPCCNQEMEISANGQLLGSMHQEWNFCMPMGTTYSVKNASGDGVFKIVAPCCPCSCGSDVVFEVIGSDGPMGSIRRTWRGLCTECCTDADNFCITFNSNLDVRYKALMLGAAFLIDFIYFERDQQH